MLSRRASRRKNVAWLAVAAVAALVLTAIWIQAHRIDPSTIPQAQLHRWATTGRAKRFDAVKPHKVVIAASMIGAQDLAEAYVARLLAQSPDAAAQGVFNTGTGQIRILGSESRFDASLPGGFHPIFYRTLRHEYGHAAFNDWLRSKDISTLAERTIAFAERRPQQVPSVCPKALEPVFREWLAQADGVYGHTYLTAILAEYMAESYARYLGGRSVPPKTAEFMERQYVAKE